MQHRLVKFKGSSHCKTFKSTSKIIGNMDFDSLPSFVNGILAGAGAVVAVMAFVFMQLIGRYEGVMGVL